MKNTKLGLALGMTWCVAAGGAFAEAGVTGSKANPSATTPSATTSSETTSSETKSTFKALDANHDGYLNKDEAQKGGMADYGVADRNADGRLDPNEFAMAHSSTSGRSTMSKPSSSSHSDMDSDSNTTRTQ